MVASTRTRKPGAAILTSLWVAAGSLALLVAGGQGNDLVAQRPPAEAAGPLWISETPLDESRRLLIVVDHQGRHAAVYHVDAAAGTLTLKSCRDLAWDLSLDDFNAQEPRPEALRKMIQLPPAAAPR